MTTDMNWFVLQRGGGHAVMDFYASLTSAHIQIEWDVQLVDTLQAGFSYGNAMYRTCAVTHRNGTPPGNPARWLCYEDQVESLDANPTYMTMYVVRSLPSCVASRLKMQKMFGSETPRVNADWLDTWADMARRVMDSPNGIFYDKWFADAVYRRGIAERLKEQLHLSIDYNEDALNQICNPRKEASSFDGPRMHKRMQQTNVLFRDEQFPVPPLPQEYLDLNTALCESFDFDREQYRRTS